MDLPCNIDGNNKVAQLDIFQIYRTAKCRRNPEAVNLSFTRSKAGAFSFAGQPDHEVLILALSGIQRATEVTFSLPATA